MGLNLRAFGRDFAEAYPHLQESLKHAGNRHISGGRFGVPDREPEADLPAGMWINLLASRDAIRRKVRIGVGTLAVQNLAIRLGFTGQLCPAVMRQDHEGNEELILLRTGFANSSELPMDNQDLYLVDVQRGKGPTRVAVGLHDLASNNFYPATGGQVLRDLPVPTPAERAAATPIELLTVVPFIASEQTGL